MKTTIQITLTEYIASKIATCNYSTKTLVKLYARFPKAYVKAVLILGGR